MISLEDFNRAINFRITGGSTYQWDCFTPDARYLDSESENYTASIVFGGPEFTVFTAEVSDYVNNRAYRLIHPDYREAHLQEAKKHGADPEQAWDNVKFIDLEVDEDWIEKCSAIVEGLRYDERVKIPVDFSDQELLKYMMAAHEMDITFNEFVSRAIRAAADRHLSK